MKFLQIIELFFFVVYPYIAFFICVFGCIFRYDREPYTWKAGSSQLLSKKHTRLANNLFHVGILMIIGGHVAGLLTPHEIYAVFITSAQKQLVAMVAGGLGGLMILAGIIILTVRRFGNKRVSKTSSFGDKAILIILAVQVCLGLSSIVVSSGHMDGSMMAPLGHYFQSGWLLNTYEGYQSIKDINLIYKIHIILGFTIILLVPFTRLAHAISMPIWYLGRKYQIVRARNHINKNI